jgi:hypothetical protein
VSHYKADPTDVYQTAMALGNRARRFAFLAEQLAAFQPQGCGQPVSMSGVRDAARQMMLAAEKVASAADKLGGALDDILEAEKEASLSWTQRHIGSRFDQYSHLLPAHYRQGGQAGLGAIEAVEGLARTVDALRRHPIKTTLNIGANFDWQAYTAINLIMNPRDPEAQRQASQYWGVDEMRARYRSGGGGMEGLSRVGGNLAAGFYLERFTGRVGSGMAGRVTGSMRTRARHLDALAERSRGVAHPPRPGDSYALSGARQNAIRTSIKAQSGAARWRGRAFYAERTVHLAGLALNLPDHVASAIARRLEAAAARRARMHATAAANERKFASVFGVRKPGELTRPDPTRIRRAESHERSAALLNAISRGDYQTAYDLATVALPDASAEDRSDKAAATDPRTVHLRSDA